MVYQFNTLQMKPYILGILLLCFPLQHTSSQVVLNADGPGNTYELINSVLANPGGDVIESPGLPAIQDVRKDNHSSFNAPNSSRHIDEIFDNTLGTGKNVFRFVIHVNEDNDRGIILTTDRQRNEIKTYNNSPNNLKGVEGETVVYKWKFKLPVGFQSSSSFTHIHQLKSVDGLYEATPMNTLTTRKGTVSVPEDQLELRYAQTSSQTTLKKTGLNKFKDDWVEVTETIKYGTAGTYSILINEANSGLELFRHPNIGASNAAINWQTGASFVRPKWGIYRSLNSSTDLRNEEVLFADFSIEENPTLSLNDITSESDNISVFPNPASNKMTIHNKGIKLYSDVLLYDFIGKRIPVIIDNNSIDISNLNSGLYFLSFNENNRIIKTIKIIKE